MDFRYMYEETEGIGRPDRRKAILEHAAFMKIRIIDPSGISMMLSFF